MTAQPATAWPRPPAPITAPSAWLADSLMKDTSWTVPLDDVHLRTLDAATRDAREAGLGAFGFDAQSVPLPAWRDLIAYCLDTLDAGVGLVMLRGIPVEQYDDESLYLLYWILAVHLGTPVVQNARGELIGEVRDRGYDYGANNVRGYNTKAELRPHCDPADCVGLMCVNPARSGGQSRVASAVSIYNEIAATEPELIEPLLNGFHFDLRGEGVTGDPDEVTFHRIPVFSYHAGQLSCRFNAKTITDGMGKSGTEMTTLEQRAVERVGTLATDPRFVLPMEFERGDVQLLCNHSILHARSAFHDDDDPASKRRLLRFWLNFPHGRTLDDRFSDRFNTGPRQGIKTQPGADYWVRG